MIGCVFFFSGCAHFGNPCVVHSSFFTSHQTDRYFRDIADKNNFEIKIPPTINTGQCFSGDKLICISFKGDDNTRKKIMEDYKEYIQKKLRSLNLPMSGERHIISLKNEEMICDFFIDYCTSKNKTEGFIMASSVVDSKGYIKIEILIFEYKGL